MWYVYAFFTYAQVKYPLGFPLIMINIYIYIYIYINVKGHVVELAPPHTQSVWVLREKRFKLRELEKKGSSCGVSSIL